MTRTGYVGSAPMAPLDGLARGILGDLRTPAWCGTACVWHLAVDRNADKVERALADLERRGLVKIAGTGDGAIVRLTGEPA